jgi:hypothetical protein
MHAMHDAYYSNKWKDIQTETTSLQHRCGSMPHMLACKREAVQLIDAIRTLTLFVATRVSVRSGALHFVYWSGEPVSYVSCQSPLQGIHLDKMNSWHLRHCLGTRHALYRCRSCLMLPGAGAPSFRPSGGAETELLLV